MTPDQCEQIKSIVATLDAGQIHLGDVKNQLMDVLWEVDASDILSMVEQYIDHISMR